MTYICYVLATDMTYICCVLTYFSVLLFKNLVFFLISNLEHTGRAHKAEKYCLYMGYLSPIFFQDTTLQSAKNIPFWLQNRQREGPNSYMMNWIFLKFSALEERNCSFILR